MRFNNQDAGLLFTMRIHIVAFLNSSASGRSWLFSDVKMNEPVLHIKQTCEMLNMIYISTVIKLYKSNKVKLYSSRRKLNNKNQQL